MAGGTALSILYSSKDADSLTVVRVPFSLGVEIIAEPEWKEMQTAYEQDEIPNHLRYGLMGMMMGSSVLDYQHISDSANHPCLPQKPPAQRQTNWSITSGLSRKSSIIFQNYVGDWKDERSPSSISLNDITSVSYQRKPNPTKVIKTFIKIAIMALVIAILLTATLSRRYESVQLLGAGIALILSTVRRFTHKGALVAFAGVDAPLYQSGTFDSKSRRVSNRGSPHLRRMPFQIASILLQHSDSNDPVFQFMDRSELKENTSMFRQLSMSRTILVFKILY